MTDTGKSAVTIDPDMKIPLPCGTRLSARVWMPDCAKSTPVPAIVEYLPYRKSDGTAARDHGMHAHFAAHGYACLRVDRRGCGESDGLFDDEYSETELADGVHVLEWIAAQPWCSGRIGIQGISWGGFNGVQIAARAPKALKAVISIGTTVDRYHDDIHYKGGVQLGENIGWAATIMSWLSTPPDPVLVGKDWRDIWLNRLEHAPFLAETWTRHSLRDAYWKHGSINEEYGRIKAPVLVMGGQHDGYRNAMVQMASNLQSPVRAIMGPWGHKYPNLSTIAPSIDYLGEALRWWDRWLKDAPTAVEDDPLYRAYIMDSIKPDPGLGARPGHWLGVRSWPPDGQVMQTLGLGHGTIGQASSFSAELETDIACSEACGEFFPFGLGPFELPDDQTPDDARSLCFESAPYEADTTILGAPELSLRVASSTEKGQIAVRLCDLRPDGTSALITMGFLNLRHRNGFDRLENMQPGQPCEVVIPLDQSAYRLPSGHQLRIAISSSYWPYIWPEGEPVTLTISAGALHLPTFPDGAGEAVTFAPPKPMAQRPYHGLRPTNGEKTRTVDDAGRITLRIHGDHGEQEDCETGLIFGSAMTEIWAIDPRDPASADVSITWTRTLGRGDWRTSTEVKTHMRGMADAFEITQTLRAGEDGTEVFRRNYAARIARN